MRKGILMDQMLKLIIEDINVTRADQISDRLKIDNDIVILLLIEMEKSEHIQLIRSGSKQVYVIIVKSPGRQFYKSSSYAELYNEVTEDKKRASSSLKLNRKILTWTIIGLLLVIILALIGYKQGWFS
jgi:hypothetical protein